MGQPCQIIKHYYPVGGYMTHQYKFIDVAPIAGSIGAEIKNVSLTDDFSTEVFDEITHAFHEHAVIFFRGQELTPEQHKSFSRRFGDLLEVPFVKALEGHPEILPVTRAAKETSKRNFGGLWHSDMSYAATPPLGSVLYSKVIPPVGGDTMWTNMYVAFERLSPAMKNMLEGLNAVHSPVKSYGSNGVLINNADPAHKMDIQTGEGADTEVIHPVVRIHPATGRKALYVNSTYTLRFEGMTEEESAPLLNFLFNHCVRPEFTCRFRWTPGAVAVWDNRCTQHLAMNDYQGFDRELYRTTIVGDRPIPVQK
jgi:taurine dioxygenase